MWIKRKTHNGLLETIRLYRKDMKTLINKNEELKKRLDNIIGNQHMPDIYCKGCKYLIVEEETNFLGGMGTIQVCALNRTCKDYEVKDNG